jgi:hypothetical protein
MQVGLIDGSKARGSFEEGLRVAMCTSVFGFVKFQVSLCMTKGMV